MAPFAYEAGRFVSGYTKLFSSILDSTVWELPQPTKIVWITMLAMASQDGEVESSVPGLAKRAGVTREECEIAIVTFLAPDADSRTQDHEGRRIEAVDGGWRLLNHEKYRHRLSIDDIREKAAKRQAKFRAGKGESNVTSNVTSQKVTPSNAASQTVTPGNESNDKHLISEAEAEAEAEKIKKNTNARAAAGIGPTPDQLDICQPYPPGDVRVYPQVRSAKVGLVEWIVHHPRCVVGKDRDLWQGLFDYAGHETMSHAYERITGHAKLWFSVFNDYIHENYEEDKPNAAQK